MRRLKWARVSGIFLVLTLGTVFATLPDGARSTLILNQPLIDRTGEVFGTRTITTTSESGAAAAPILAVGNQAFTPTDLSLMRNDGETVDQSSEGSDGIDAQGVIIELNDEPILVVRGRALREKKSPAEIDSLLQAQKSQLASAHGRMKSQIARAMKKPITSIRHLEFTDALNAIALLDVGVNEAIRKFSGNPDVKKISPNGKVRTQLVQSIPQIKANLVWSYTGANSTALDGTGTRIGIIDTGVDYSHKDLGGCFGASCKVAGGFDFVNNDSDPMDDQGHGTHVAATAAGNGILAGVAPGAKIYAYKVLGADGSGFNTAIISAIERCVDPNRDGNYTDHLDVCSMSLGGSGNPDDAMSTAVDTATINGVVFTVAAGNSGPASGTIASPGTARRAITVAAACKSADIGTDPTCTTPIAQFSSQGPVTWTDSSGISRTLAKPDLASPGHKICAAQWGSAWSDRQCLDVDHVSLSGTSMATPHVAGVAALIRQAHPEFSPDQVKNILMASSTNLGQPIIAQGAGQVDTMNALNLSGIPSSIAQISGVPLSITDNPTVLNAVYTKSLSIKNTSSGSLTYTPSFTADQSGVTASFSSPALTIPAGGSAPLSVTFRIDHSVVASPKQVGGMLTLTTSAGTAKAGVSIYVLDRLIANQTVIDLGVDMPTTATWTASQSLTLTNVMTDTSATYSVALDMGNAAISATTDRTSITLAPGASAPLGINLTVNNSALPNTRYSGTLRLTSPNQSLALPVTFFKGYGIRFSYGTGPAPVYIQYHQGNALASLLRPGSTTTSTLLYVTGAGPWSAHGLWLGDASPVNSTHVVRGEVLLNQPITDFSMAQADATHTLSFNPVGPSGSTNIPNATFKWGIIHRASGNKMDISGGTFSGGSVKVSDIPSSYTFLASGGGADTNGLLLSYAYRLANGITNDLNLTNTATALVKKSLAGFQNQDSTSGTALYPSFCFPNYVSSSSVYLPGSCYNASWVKTTLSPNQMGTLYSYNHGAEDLASAQSADFPLMGLYSALPTDQSTFPFLYQSPLFYITPTNTSAFVNAASGIKPYFTKASTAFQDYRMETPPGGFLSVGMAPVYDSSRWYNYADTDVSLSSQRGVNLPLHLWGDSSDEWIRIWNPSKQGQLATAYTLTKDGTPIASGSVSITNGTKLAITPPLSGGLAQPGNYRFELNRQALIDGKTTQVSTVSTFKIVSVATHQAQPVDENPPAVTGIHLLTNGIWQNVIGLNRANTLSFRVDPLAGFLAPLASPAPLGSYSLMADSLSSVTAEMSTDAGANWSALPLTVSAGNTYSASIPSTVNSALYHFRINASDAARNTLTHSFQIPTGSVLAQPDSTAPTTSITSPTNGQTLSGMVTVSASAADNMAVTKVELLRNGAIIGTSTTNPYTFVLNTSLFPNGSTTLQTKAYDSAGNTGVSSTVSVTIQNLSDTTAPSVSITTPLTGSTVSKRTTISIAANASDASGVTRVDFYVNSALLCGDTTAPYGCAWKVPNKAGAFQIQAFAYDKNANVGSSSVVNITSK